MASPEYHQTAEDHSSLLILVKQVSPDHQLSVRSFDKIYERISRITEVKIGDAQGLGLERIIRIRYKKNDYSEECNDWGDFQYHRKLLGLISIGKVLHNRDEDMDEITGNHESAVETYASTLLDSRCFVFLGSGSASSTEEQPASNQNNHVYDRTSVGRMNSRSSVSSFHDPETPTKSGVQFPPSLLTPSHLAQEEVVDEEDKVKEKDESDREIDVDSGNQRNADSRDEGRTQCLDEDSGNHSIDPIVIQDDEAGNGGITAAAAAAQVEKLDHPVAPRPPAAPAEDSDSTPADDDETNDEEEENDGRCEKKGVNARSFVNKANGANENGVTKSSLSSSSSPSPAVTSDVMLPSERIAVVNQADPLSLPKHKNIQSIMYQSACGGITNEVSEASLSSIEGRLEEDIRDLISSLFWVLESKRLDRSHEKVSSSKINLLMAPFEGKTLVGVDTKKRALGRVKKQLGDLSLMAGSPSEALIQYGTAIDILRGTGDFLWMAAALEGQCVASLSLLYPTNGRRDISLQRNASLPPQKVSEINRVTSRSQSQQDHKSRSSVARSPSTASSHSPSPVNSNSNNSSPTNSSKRRLKGTFSLNARSSSSSGSSNSHHKDKSSDMVKALSKIALQSPLDFSEKYKEACCHYAKFRNAAVIEMECSFKAARVMTFLDQHMNAAEFIQNAVFISLNQSNDEQIERLNVISNLYTDIGFHRKAAFYKRFAALKAVSLQLQQPNWSQCYNLLISSMEGYNLTLDPCEYERRIRERDSSSGWTGIHVQLLQELVTTAKRMNATPVAIRHLSFLLQVLSSSLTSSQKKEFASQLESLSRVCGEGAPVPLNLDSGFVIPSVNLTKFPYITSFLCKNLPPHLRPFKLKSKLELDAPKLTPNSPFIFTPLNLTRPITPRRSSIGSAASQTLDFKWVQHETGSVLVQVYNQLPMELTVDHMKLVTNGLPFEVMPISVSFGPDSGPTPITLTGTPKSAGKLELNGYSTHVLGVKSNCLLKDLPHGRKMRVPHQFVIDVVPALPLLSISCPDLDKSTAASFFSNEIDYISANYALQIFAGESRSVNIFLSNSSSHSDQMIEKINLKMISRLKKFEEKQFISLNCDALTQDENIPLAPGSSFEFAIDFYGFSDFVHEDKNRLTVPGASTQGRRKSGTSTPMQQSSQQIFLGSNSGISSPSGIRNKQNNNNNNNNNLQIGTALSNFLSKLQSGTASPKIAKDKRGAGDPDRPDSSLEIYPSKVCVPFFAGTIPIVLSPRNSLPSFFPILLILFALLLPYFLPLSNLVDDVIGNELFVLSSSSFSFSLFPSTNLFSPRHPLPTADVISCNNSFVSQATACFTLFL